MSISGTVLSGDGTGNTATVTHRGQLVVAPLDFSNPIEHDLCCACVGTTFFPPESAKQFVITDIFVNTNRSTPTAGIVVEIYESCADASLTVDKCIFAIDLPKQSGVGHTSLNFLINKGKWLNAKIEVSTGVVSITVAGYYIAA